MLFDVVVLMKMFVCVVLRMCDCIAAPYTVHISYELASSL